MAGRSFHNRAQGEEWTQLWHHFYSDSQRNFNTLLVDLTGNESISGVWSQYVQNLAQFQEQVRQVNARWLQAAGFPTREDVSRVSQQLHDVTDRLEEVEQDLTARLERKAAENAALKSEVNYLKDELNALRAKLDRLQSDDKQQ